MLLPGVVELLPLAVEVVLPLVAPVLDEPDAEPVFVSEAGVLSDETLPVVPLPLSVLSVVPELLVSLPDCSMYWFRLPIVTGSGASWRTLRKVSYLMTCYYGRNDNILIHTALVPIGFRTVAGTSQPVRNSARDRLYRTASTLAARSGLSMEANMAASTTDHDTIRKWADKHKGRPAAVESTQEGGDVGIIRIMFPDSPNSEHDNLVEISWEEFFQNFDENNLALVYEPSSMFSKLVSRESS